MRSLLKTARSHISPNDSHPIEPRAASSSSPTLDPPTSLDIARYRKHHGVNLGSIFVLEQWLFPSMFESTAKGGSELDAVAASVAAHGLDNTRQRWEQHWASALSDAEIQWLATSGHVTTVRIPLGYFSLGPAYCSSTPFEPYGSVYTNSWKAVLSLAERLARIGGIGVLLDMHALPGGANDQDHSGTSSHKAELWGNQSNLRLAKLCAVFVAGEVARGKVGMCVGLQLCNEAMYGAGGKGMYTWVQDVLKAVGQIDATIPIYVSDAWDTSEALRWGAKTNRITVNGNPVAAASSKYYCFSDQDRAKSPQQIIDQVQNSELGEVSSFQGDVIGKGAAQVFATEWSCVFDTKTKARASSGDLDSLISRFGQVQTQRYDQQCGGEFFWTAKMDWMDGGEWGFIAMTKKGAVVAPAYLSASSDSVRATASKASQSATQMRADALRSHTAYWKRQSPTTTFEHWRFDDGYKLGFADAQAFFRARINGAWSGATAGGDFIGSVELWVLRRLRMANAAQMGNFAWEFETGFRQGIAGFSGLVMSS